MHLVGDVIALVRFLRQVWSIFVAYVEILRTNLFTAHDGVLRAAAGVHWNVRNPLSIAGGRRSILYTTSATLTLMVFRFRVQQT